MSVVAGCSLFDGVLLAADCRATIRVQNKPDTHSDSVLKVFALLPHTAIGFVGDIDIASFLLQSLLSQLSKRRRNDPISLSLWIPRLFRHQFKRYTEKRGHRSVVFMVASVLRDRRNIVERKAVAKLVEHIGFGHSPIQRNWIPGFLVEILKIPATYKWVEMPGTCRNILYTLASPNFKIRFFSNLVEESLVNFQLKISQVMKAVGFTFNDFDFVINPFQFTGMDRVFTMVQNAIAMAFKHFYKAV